MPKIKRGQAVQTKFELMIEYIFNTIRAKQSRNFTPNIAREYEYKNEKLLKQIEAIENQEKEGLD